MYPNITCLRPDQSRAEHTDTATLLDTEHPDQLVGAWLQINEETAVEITAAVRAQLQILSDSRAAVRQAATFVSNTYLQKLHQCRADRLTCQQNLNQLVRQHLLVIR